MTINKLCADKEIIEQFNTEITKDWRQFGEQCGKFEIRCIGQNRTTVTQIFTLDEQREAIDFAMRMNAAKLNVYMMINPINPQTEIKASKGATDHDILRAHYSFADADDLNGMLGLEKLCSKLPPDITVTTGTIPYKRSHAYWKLTEPCEDMLLWGDKQAHIATQCHTDRRIRNASRLMRLPGTVSFPSSAKQTKGYVPELVTMKLEAS